MMIVINVTSYSYFFPLTKRKNTQCLSFITKQSTLNVSVNQARIRKRTDTKECKPTEEEKQIRDQIIHTKGDEEETEQNRITNSSGLWLAAMTMNHMYT